MKGGDVDVSKTALLTDTRTAFRAEFGPNLTRIAAKLPPGDDRETLEHLARMAKHYADRITLALKQRPHSEPRVRSNCIPVWGSGGDAA